MKRIIIFLIAGMCLVSCATARFQPVSDTYSGEVRVDSVFVLDSVYIDRIRIVKEKADTVYVTDWKTEYKIKYRDRVKIDTLVQEKVITQIREVEKDLTWWQNFRLKGFWVLLGLVALWIVWKIMKLWLHL